MIGADHTTHPARAAENQVAMQVVSTLHKRTRDTYTYLLLFFYAPDGRDRVRSPIRRECLKRFGRSGTITAVGKLYY
jgi:hypothetical protein